MLGLGNVANSFTEVIKKVENAELVLIASLSKNKLNSLMLTASEPLLYKKIDKVLDRAKKAEIMDVFLIMNYGRFLSGFDTVKVIIKQYF